jgi:serine protease Do
MKLLKRSFYHLTYLLSVTHSIEAAEENVPPPPYYQDFTTVAEKAIPGVVSIEVKIKSEEQKVSFSQGGFGEDFFQQFFNFPLIPQQPRDEQGQASGFIASKDGYIVTNSHVAGKATEIEVVLNDGRRFPAKLVGSDPSTDVAIVKIEANDLPALEFADSEKLKVGQWAIAIGSPLGLDASLTVGVVSAKGRNNLDITRIEDFIQTDAAINRGNSGGPLLNLQGEVIGMNTAIVSNNGSGGYMGIGFAIPSNIIKNDMEQIVATGSIARGFIGVALQQVDSDLAQALGLEKTEGVLIAEVTKDSPAEKAGLKQGDVILKYDGHDAKSVGSFRNAVALMKPGSQIKLSLIRRDKQNEDLIVEIGSLSSSDQVSVTPASKENKFGFEVQELTPDLAKTHKLSENKGVMISKVNPSSAAAWAGLKKGTLLLGINQQNISSVDQFNQIMDSLDLSKPVLLLVKQGEVTRFISIKLK